MESIIDKDHCHECKKPLGKDRYDVSPVTGGCAKDKSWCAECYENLTRKSIRAKVYIFGLKNLPKNKDY